MSEISFMALPSPKRSPSSVIRTDRRGGHVQVKQYDVAACVQEAMELWLVLRRPPHRPPR